MALGPRLDLRQTQSLVMTPQLQQAIKLLQMTNLEVAAFVEQQIEQNPLLEREDPDGGMESAEADPGTRVDAEAQAGETDQTANTLEDAPEAPDAADLTGSETLLERDDVAIDADFDNVWDNASPSDGGSRDDPYWRGADGRGDYAGEGLNLENMLADEVSLRDHLMEQINVDIHGQVERLIALQLLDSLDDSGYLTADLDAVANALGCPPAQVETTLTAMQRFDPAGIFARNLSECLALQLRDLNRLDPAMQILLDHLDLLGKRDFGALRRLCGVSQEDFVDMINEIKSLNPKPASVFDRLVAQPVVPDVFVRPDKAGGWIVELNTETLPRVLLNSRYYATVSARAKGKSDRQYLIDCYQTASWLVRSLQQRAQTILKVATELVHQQSDFLTKGIQHLRPLTLRDIAEAVGVHESTVSRVTNNKYLGTSRGIYEMKYFFTSAISHTDSGEAHSAESIRFRIKTLIDGESAEDVLSDDKIVDILRRDGVDIARRTVAKYREAMRIPSSVRRRREKALNV